LSKKHCQLDKKNLILFCWSGKKKIKNKKIKNYNNNKKITNK